MMSQSPLRVFFNDALIQADHDEEFVRFRLINIFYALVLLLAPCSLLHSCPCWYLIHAKKDMFLFLFIPLSHSIRIIKTKIFFQP